MPTIVNGETINVTVPNTCSNIQVNGTNVNVSVSGANGVDALERKLYIAKCSFTVGGQSTTEVLINNIPEHQITLVLDETLIKVRGNLFDMAFDVKIMGVISNTGGMYDDGGTSEWRETVQYFYKLGDTSEFFYVIVEDLSIYTGE